MDGYGWIKLNLVKHDDLHAFMSLQSQHENIEVLEFMSTFIIYASDL